MALAIAMLLGIGHATVSAAQSGPGASLAGTWTLDPYVSDHPEQVARALRFDTGQADQGVVAGPNGREGEFGRGGFGRNGSGGFGRPGTTRGQAREPLSAADQKLLSELTDTIRFAPTTLTIAQTDTTVSISTGATLAPDTLHTDGKAEKHQLTSGTVERTARWEGPQHLVVEYEVGHAGTLTYTYQVAPTTGQLVVRINFERRPGEPGPFEIKLVYDPVTRAAGAH
jgi:hypothetical protein